MTSDFSAFRWLSLSLLCASCDPGPDPDTGDSAGESDSELVPPDSDVSTLDSEESPVDTSESPPDSDTSVDTSESPPDSDTSVDTSESDSLPDESDVSDVSDTGPPLPECGDWVQEGNEACDSGPYNTDLGCEVTPGYVLCAYCTLGCELAVSTGFGGVVGRLTAWEVGGGGWVGGAEIWIGGQRVGFTQPDGHFTLADVVTGEEVTLRFRSPIGRGGAFAVSEALAVVRVAQSEDTWVDVRALPACLADMVPEVGGDPWEIRAPDTACVGAAHQPARVRVEAGDLTLPDGEAWTPELGLIAAFAGAFYAEPSGGASAARWLALPATGLAVDPDTGGELRITPIGGSDLALSDRAGRRLGYAPGRAVYETITLAVDVPSGSTAPVWGFDDVLSRWVQVGTADCGLEARPVDGAPVTVCRFERAQSGWLVVATPSGQVACARLDVQGAGGPAASARVMAASAGFGASQAVVGPDGAVCVEGAVGAEAVVVGSTLGADAWWARVPLTGVGGCFANTDCAPVTALAPASRSVRCLEGVVYGPGAAPLVASEITLWGVRGASPSAGLPDEVPLGQYTVGAAGEYLLDVPADLSQLWVRFAHGDERCQGRATLPPVGGLCATLDLNTSCGPWP